MPIDLEREGLETHRSPLAAMRCEACGYGISRATAPSRCPMCGGAEWSYDRWRPFSDLQRDLASRRRPL